MLGCNMAGMFGAMWFGWLGGLLILAVLVGLGVWVMRRFGQQPPGTVAGRILEERFARGEISAEEFQGRARILEGAQ